MKVWDAAVRTLHWALAAGVALAWLTSELSVHWHEPLGWGVLGAAVLRALWGIAGPRHARFTTFVRGPRHTLHYAKALLARREPRHLGHNPLGGWMVVLLLACSASAAITGWLCTTDRYWGDDTMFALHLGLAWTVAALCAVHVVGIFFTGLRHRENLVLAMFNGRKRAPREGDVD